jgi:hypothetical protein
MLICLFYQFINMFMVKCYKLDASYAKMYYKCTTVRKQETPVFLEGKFKFSRVRSANLFHYLLFKRSCSFLKTNTTKTPNKKQTQ